HAAERQLFTSCAVFFLNIHTGSLFLARITGSTIANSFSLHLDSSASLVPQYYSAALPSSTTTVLDPRPIPINSWPAVRTRLTSYAPMHNNAVDAYPALDSKSRSASFASRIPLPVP